MGNPEFKNLNILLRGNFMEKHLIITGASTVSWKDAIVKTIDEASKTLDYLTGVKIIEQKAKINGNKISEYYVDLDLTFMIDRNRQQKGEFRMEKVDTAKEYNEYVNKKSPDSPILKNCFNAFWVGGLICSIGQIILTY